jgi:ectoine hydroxylase-related dioxygenase (phytanoyl-CoA dioxygenase family)
MNWNSHSLKVPWVISPFFKKEIEDRLSRVDPEKRARYSWIANRINADRYCNIGKVFDDSFCNEMISETQSLIKNPSVKIQDEHYNYNKSARIFEAWRNSANVSRVACNKEILDILSFLFGEQALPFSTINFSKGSSQPIHSDTIHFQSMPKNWVLASWAAFEDVDESNGALIGVPGSHRWNDYEYYDLGIPDAKSDGFDEEKSYRLYESFAEQLIEANQAEVKALCAKKGEVIIWISSFLHGGGKTVEDSTRYSQANHFFSESSEVYYHPMFSRSHFGEFAKKWCDKDNNILRRK